MDPGYVTMEPDGPAGAPAAPREEASDEALVERLGRGDAEALRALHRRHAALVFTVASRVVDAASAEEVVQEVFLTLWRKHATFDAARGSVKAWLLAIARRRALNELRRRRGQSAGEEELESLADDALQPDEAQWLAHRRAVIRAAVDALPTAQRQALSLAYFDELSHDQIAQALHTPLGTTKTRIRAALRRLAPVLLVALAVTVVVIIVRRREERTARVEAALRMVTASDVVPLRLDPAPGVPAEAHGNYRARLGASVAVLTTSHLPPPGGTESYVAWARWGGRWKNLGTVTLEPDGRSLLAADIGPERPAPDELRVTREVAGEGEAPRGEAVLTWPVAPAPR